jgi:hypothetical protein
MMQPERIGCFRKTHHDRIDGTRDHLKQNAAQQDSQTDSQQAACEWPHTTKYESQHSANGTTHETNDQLQEAQGSTDQMVIENDGPTTR